MKYRKQIMLVIQVVILHALLVVCVPTYAQPASRALEPAENSGKFVVPLKLNQSAPYAGLLIPELRLTELLEAEIKVDELKGQLDIEGKLLIGLEKIYLKRLGQATELPKWYETNTFYWWLGFTVGAVLTGTAIYLAVEVMEAQQ